MCKNIPAEYIKKQVLLFIFDFCCTFAEIFAGKREKRTKNKKYRNVNFFHIKIIAGFYGKSQCLKSASKHCR